jgi:hypothetical protein
MPLWSYALACVVVPCLIGVTMYALFELWERRRRRSRPDAPPPMIDYWI